MSQCRMRIERTLVARQAAAVKNIVEG